VSVHELTVQAQLQKRNRTKSTNCDFSASRDTNSHCDLGLIWISPKEFECLDLVDFGVVAISVETFTRFVDTEFVDSDDVKE